MTKRSLVVATAVLVLFSGTANAIQVGEVAPDFTRADVNGKHIQLSKYRGKLVLLNFWASWCEPCREEMPLFSKWQRELGARGLQLIGVSMDDDAREVHKFLAAYPVTYPVVMGDARFAEHFGGVLGLPLSYLIDAQGLVVARYQGEVDLQKLEVQLMEQLARSVKQ
jgi:cytochrome c biogenesis protein CcmG, thiol:disulfide interchange protein DsbE